MFALRNQSCGSQFICDSQLQLRLPNKCLCIATRFANRKTFRDGAWQILAWTFNIKSAPFSPKVRLVHHPGRCPLQVGSTCPTRNILARSLKLSMHAICRFGLRACLVFYLRIATKFAYRNQVCGSQIKCKHCESQPRLRIANEVQAWRTTNSFLNF